MLGFIIFIVAWCIGIVSWFFAIYEFIAVHRLTYSSFRYGRLVYVASEPISLPAHLIKPDQIIKTRNGRFKFVNEQECLLSRKIFVIFPTPFPIKGKIRWHNGMAKIEGRIPLGTTVFLGAWLVGWTDGALMATGSNSLSLFSGLIFLLFGWLIAGGMYFFSIPFEVRRAQRIVDELKVYLANRHSVQEAS